MANATRTEPSLMRRIRTSLLRSRNRWEDSQEIVGNVVLNPDNVAGTFLIDIAQTRGQIGYDGVAAYINTNANKDIQLKIAGTVAAKVTYLKNVVLGLPNLGATATDGFAYLPLTTGTPTGVPTAHTGYAPFCVASDGTKLWIYAGGAWKSAALV